MLRTRDVVALFFTIALVHIAWNRQESLSASIHLSFYVPQSNAETAAATPTAILPSVFDLDGDGHPDSLVQVIDSAPDAGISPYMNKLRFWRVRVLNLQAKSTAAPFSPPSLVSSEPISERDIGRLPSPVAPPLEPLELTVGHVLIQRDYRRSKKPDEATNGSTKDSGSASKLKDFQVKNRHYFCGVDWNHAARKCMTPCPSGSNSDCPEGQRCFADTPCDLLTYDKELKELAEQQEDRGLLPMESLLTDTRNVTRTYMLSPVGGLPSVMMLWSNGMITMQSLTAKRSSGIGSKANQSLEVQMMWKTNLVPDGTKYVIMEWTESTLDFVDAVDSNNDSGMLVVTASLELLAKSRPEEDTVSAKLVATVHARTGKIVWRDWNVEDPWEQEEQHSTPMVAFPLEQRGTLSAARRRSWIPNLHSPSGSNTVQDYQNCLQSAFRRPMLSATSSMPNEGALPFAYWTDQDASARLLHFDLEKSSGRKSGSSSQPGGNPAAEHVLSPGIPLAPKQPQKNMIAEKNDRRKRRRKLGTLHGRPNVLVLHNQNGVEVRSWKNGRIMCHLSLGLEALYADINHDGTFDSVQLALGGHDVDPDDVEEDDEEADNENRDDDLRFVKELAKRVSEQSDHRKRKRKRNRSNQPSKTRASLCHLLSLSGLPSREELFSYNLCAGSANKYQQLVGTTPLLVEPRDASGRKGWDIVVALNNGLVTRVHGGRGRRQWRLQGHRHNRRGSFPHWKESDYTLLSRVNSAQTVPSERPILLVGEDALAILSASTGHILTSSALPQPSTGQPMLVDFDGDGTTDILVPTKDAIWGFQLVVSTGSSVFLRVVVGLLLVGVLLAILRNRFGPTPGRRSTDAPNSR